MSWTDPSVFGELQFCSMVEPDSETASDADLDAGVDAGSNTDQDAGTDTAITRDAAAADLDASLPL
jgi:hypothetical protein